MNILCSMFGHHWVPFQQHDDELQGLLVVKRCCRCQRTQEVRED